MASAADVTFFTELPPELRWRIYLFAFGRGVIHLNTVDQDTENPWQTGNLSIVDRGGGLPEDLRWRISVCHRSPQTEFFDDSCEEQTADEGQPHSLGVLAGFCRVVERRFYSPGEVTHADRPNRHAETVDFIQRSNTFHFFGGPLPTSSRERSCCRTGSSRPPRSSCYGYRLFGSSMPASHKVAYAWRISHEALDYLPKGFSQSREIEFLHRGSTDPEGCTGNQGRSLRERFTQEA